MNVKAKILGAAMGVIGMAGVSGAALAASVTPPGERAGVDIASPLPEGVYFENLGSIGNFRLAAPGTSTFDYEIPVIAWSTPWTILGARFEVIAAAPMASISAAHLTAPGGPNVILRGIYNPFISGALAYNFGNGFSASYLAGAYIAVPGSNLIGGGAPIPSGTVLIQNPFDQTTFQQMLALAYHMNGWNAVGNFYYSIVGQNVSCNCNQGVFANFFNADMSLTKTIGSWEIGIIGYYSTDTRKMTPAYQLQSQFALGGLIGYNFGHVITQFTVASDVYERNYSSYETRFLSRIIVPIWHPEVPKAVEAKY